ncbi:MAG: adenosylmethionine--8-amino-7-oxononanoate transaminase [Cyclobacteriaceae bacterium]|nr:adenosylmethionine--8-amino-7-oxononanoate transaminase [Cytophagales bacterium]MCZ8327483.1 adenosylmethionine--8-amino-7-oxononanoate transaminase [Cyclobacteriaceae bacterium]
MTDLQQIDKAIVWHPFTPQEGELPDNIIAERGEGTCFITPDGRKIIDAIASWWVNLHGHAHPVIANALAAQAKKLEHVMFAGFTHEPAVTLAQNLLSQVDASFTKVFYSDNGSTANEVALKLAMQFWYNQGISKPIIVALDGAYHGDTFGAMAVGERSIFTHPFTPYLFEVKFLDFPTGQNDATVIQQFKQIAEQQTVGAFIFEPLIQGASGMRMYKPETLQALLEIAKQHSIITIADEVFTGFYRTGKFLATHHITQQPDIIALSKGITGGALPLGATLVSQDIYQAFVSADFSKAFLHGHSYTANPLACAAANASFELLMQADCQQRIQRIAQRHQQFIEKIKNHAALSDCRALGTICAFEIKTQTESGYTNTVRDKILHYFLSKNILLRPLGNIFYLVPPYCITNEELDYIYAEIENFLHQLFVRDVSSKT